MSSLSHSPYWETLRYWASRKETKNCRLRFLLTKYIEMRSFKKKAFPLPPAEEARKDYAPFAPSVKNSITEESRIAVVVPCYASSAESVRQIQRLRGCLLKQTFSAAQIFFIDDCSPVPLGIESAGNVAVLRQEKNQGPAAARNRGLEAALDAGADIIAFTDSDCVPDENWLFQIRAAFLSDRECSIVSGKTVSFGSTWFDRYHNINGTLNGRRFKESGTLLYGPTCNLAVSADTARAVQFDSDFPLAAGEDIHFCLRANKKGFAVKYNQKMIVRHDFSYGHFFVKNLRRFIKQFERYTDGEAVLLRKNPGYYIYFEETEGISSI